MNTVTQQQLRPTVPVIDEDPMAVLSLPSWKARWVLFAITAWIGVLVMRTTGLGIAVTSIRLMFIGLALLAGVSSNWSA